MSLNAKKEQSGNGEGFVEQSILEPGTYPARTVQIIDLGVQDQRPFKGEEKKPVHQMMVTYEVVEEFMKDEDGNDMEDKPRWLSENFPFYNLSSDRATSTKRYHAIDPKGVFEGDWTQLVDMPCDLVVGEYVRKSGKYEGKPANGINGVNAMRTKHAEKCQPLVDKPKVFVLDTPDMEVFGSLPDWLQDKIKGNHDYEGSKLQALLNGTEVPADEDGDDEEW